MVSDDYKIRKNVINMKSSKKTKSQQILLRSRSAKRNTIIANKLFKEINEGYSKLYEIIDEYRINKKQSKYFPSKNKNWKCNLRRNIRMTSPIPIKKLQRKFNDNIIRRKRFYYFSDIISLEIFEIKNHEMDEIPYQEIIDSSVRSLGSHLNKRSIGVAINLLDEMNDKEWFKIEKVYEKLLKTRLRYKEIYYFVVNSIENLCNINCAKSLLKYIDADLGIAALKLAKLWLNIYHTVYYMNMIKHMKKRIHKVDNILPIMETTINSTQTEETVEQGSILSSRPELSIHQKGEISELDSTGNSFSKHTETMTDSSVNVEVFYSSETIKVQNIRRSNSFSSNKEYSTSIDETGKSIDAPKFDDKIQTDSEDLLSKIFCMEAGNGDPTNINAVCPIICGAVNQGDICHGLSTGNIFGYLNTKKLSIMCEMGVSFLLPIMLSSLFTNCSYISTVNYINCTYNHLRSKTISFFVGVFHLVNGF